MAHDLPPRTSKIQAVANMTAMVEQSYHSRHTPCPVMLRFPKRIWNAAGPQMAIGTKKKSTDSALLREKTRRRPRALSCRRKLWRFCYGGPDKRMLGKRKHEITYQGPCLRATCVTCSKWYADLLITPTVGGFFGGDVGAERPEVESLGLEIDPRILDGSWREFVGWRDGEVSPQVVVKEEEEEEEEEEGEMGILTPVEKMEMCSVSSPVYDVFSPGKCEVFLPRPLLGQTTSGAETCTRWRSEPRQRYTTKLRFTTREGRIRFRALLRKRGKEDGRRGYDKSRWARSKGRAGGECGKGAGRRKDIRAKGRHVTRLVFTSQEGQRAFRGLVEMYLR